MTDLYSDRYLILVKKIISFIIPHPTQADHTIWQHQMQLSLVNISYFAHNLPQSLTSDLSCWSWSCFPLSMHRFPPIQTHSPAFTPICTCLCDVITDFYLAHCIPPVHLFSPSTPVSPLHLFYLSTPVLPEWGSVVVVTEGGRTAMWDTGAII